MKALFGFGIALAVVSAGITTPALAGAPPELTPTELAQVQSQRFSAPPKVAFGAVLSTLQTLGYVDVNANKDAGTISAITDAKAKTFFNIFWGFGKKKLTQKASVLIEEDGAGSRVRLNMMLSETKARGIFGTSFSDGKLVRWREPYQQFFQYLQADLAHRGVGAVVAAGGPAIDAGGTIDLGGGVKLVPAQTLSGYCIKAAAGYVGTGASNSPAITAAKPLCS